MSNGFKRNQNKSELFRLASGQNGFFTAAQALTAGYIDEVHGYHVRSGNWIRVGRGIYRLAFYPPPSWPELTILWLWSRNRGGVPQGTFSHETALMLHGLPGGRREPVHVTVPLTFRRNAPCPAGVVIHKANLGARAVTERDGLPVTTVAQTLQDVQPEPRPAPRVLPADAADAAELSELSPSRERRSTSGWAVWDSAGKAR